MGRRNSKRWHARLASVGLLSIASCGLAATAADAQDSPPQSPNAGQNDDIIVTARKRDESQQDAPVTVTTVTAADIEARNLSTIVDLSNFTPNVSFTGGGVEIGAPVNASFFIRGIGQSDFAPTTEPGVGLYVDGVFFARAAGAVLELANLQQVEVLKGPQGTLFGKNTMGGAINVTTLRPTLEEVSGSASITLGEDERFNLDGTLNVPLTANLALRLDAAHRSQEGFVRRPNADDKVGDEGTTIAAGKLLWEPADTTRILLSGDYTRVRAAAPVAVFPVYDPSASGLVQAYNALVGGPSGEPITAANRSPDLYTDFGTGRNYSRYDGGGASLRMETGSETTFRSITAYREFKTRNQRDADGSPATFNQSDYRDRQWQISQEINVLGEIAGGRGRYTLGAFYFRERARSAYNSDIAQGLFDVLEALPGPFIPLGPFACPGGPACAGGAGNPLNVIFDLNATDFLDVRSESAAAFAEFEWDLSDAFTVFGGLRYTYDSKWYDVSFERLRTGTFIVPPTTVARSWRDVSPRVGIRWNINPDAMLYASVSEGYKAGGFNPRPGDQAAALIAYDPETVRSYEAGLKTDLLDRRLRFNTAIFYYDYRDLQLYVETLLPGAVLPTQIIDNVGKARIWGVESDILFRATDALTLNASVGYLNAKYTDPASAITGLTEDTPFKKAPKWSATAGAQYFVPLASGELLLRGDYAYTSTSFAETNAIRALRQEPRHLVNARVAWTNASETLTVAAYGKNILDDSAIINGFDARPFNGSLIAIPSEPRELGVQAILRF